MIDIALSIRAFGTSLPGYTESYRNQKATIRILISMPSTSLLNYIFWRCSPPEGQGLLIHEYFRSHTTTHHIR